MDNETLITDLKSRLTQLKDTRTKFEDNWTQAEKYVSKNVYNWGDLDAVPYVPKRFTSSPCNYLQTLVNGLVGYSISPSIVWFKLSLQDERLIKEYGVKDWLENVETVMLSEFSRSNLYNAAPIFIDSAATIGHGVMLIDEDLVQERLRFSCMRPNEIYLDVNEYGEVDTVYRTFLITIRNAVSFFGEDNVSEQVREDYKSVEKWNNKIEILFAVYPRKEYDSRNPNAENMPYAAVYVDVKNDFIIKESGFRDFPYAVFEWEPIPGFAYSMSPAQNAIPDIKFLNVTKETSMKICQTSAEPPLKASDHLKNISVVPRGLTLVTTKDDVLETIKTGENYPITLQITESIKQDVKDWFNVDFFLMLQQKEGQMTATEVMELQGEKSAVLSNMIVALNNSLGQIIHRSFNILMRAGRLPPPPESLSGTNAMIKIDYMGPLAQAQKKYHSSGTVAQALSAAANVMQVFPNSGDYVNADELIKKAMESAGMPETVIREDKDVQNIRAEKAAQQQAAQQQANQMQGAQMVMSNLNKLNEPVKQGSALSELNKQLSGGINGAT